jgi:hypothetical protein
MSRLHEAHFAMAIPVPLVFTPIGPEATEPPVLEREQEPATIRGDTIAALAANALAMKP